MTATTLDRIWTRPALMIFTEDQPVSVNAASGQWNLGSDFLYLTDDGRSEMQVTLERIEYKKRMINGRMRSYHVADKKSFSVSWTDLPSKRNELSEVRFSSTKTGWASCQEMLSWYASHTDSFFLTLVYDTPTSSSAVPLKNSLETYNVFFDDFSYVIKKRGPLTDLWDIGMTLVEV
jgi:hypothetical protein